MKRIFKYLGYLYIALVFITLFFSKISESYSLNNIIDINNLHNYFAPPDTGLNDSLKNKELPYPIKDDKKYDGGVYLNSPSNVKEDVVYDPESKQYIIKDKVGENEVGQPKFMNMDEYKKYSMDEAMKKYWREKTATSDIDKKGLAGGKIPKIHVPGKVFDQIFGSDVIEIKPQGSAELIFAVKSNKRDDPALDVRQRRTTNFDFQEKIQMNVTAKIGDKITLQANYNTEASFEFENKMKLEYTGKEDEIIKKIEAGDVSLPLSGSLITGSQALFGIKTQLQFGKTTVTTVFSQQKSESSVVESSGGAQISKFEVKGDQYEENRHFLLSQYFKDNYDYALEKLPIVRSNVIITRIELWVTNIGPAIGENRNIVAFADLGEVNPYRKEYTINSFASPYPANNKNILYEEVKSKNIRDIKNVSSSLSSMGLSSGADYEKIENARLLSTSEYSFNPKVGFISLNTSLNSDHVLAVAFQYKIIGDTATYQVGEFSNDGINSPQTLYLKLLKGTATNTKIPLWDLMMKNVYSIGGYQINSNDFRFNVLYSNEENGVPMGYLPVDGIDSVSGLSLIRVLNLDRLNSFYDLQSDGFFDFIDNAATNGGTIESRNGRIYFPVLEPFGNYLRNKLKDKKLGDKYAFDSLYRSTKTIAQQFPEKNRFSMVGSYKSSSGSEIRLNAFNVPKGSVKVTAGSIPLTENVDYTVNYTAGTVKIINDGILNSGVPVKVSLESNSLFNIQTKTLMGLHVDHKVSNKLLLGGTIMNLTERPLTQKVNIGDDPISNTIWGVNATYQTEAPIITKLVDLIPFYNTKEKSNLTFSGEFAQLIPGHPKSIGKNGIVYLDDFEGSRSAIDLKNYGNWVLASVPNEDYPDLFPESKLSMDSALHTGFNRAKLAWYSIDQLFTTTKNNLTPSHIKNDKDQLSNHFVREVLETEVFPNKESYTGQPMPLTMLNVAYYPKEKGPYNFDVLPTTISSGIDNNGFLNSPESRWGGIMRRIENTNFEELNYETIEFWLLDPFVYDSTQAGGDMYFNLGDISEDILKDGKKSFENGLPITQEKVNVDTTQWGIVPKFQAMVNSFDNNTESRKYQDVGLDGLSDNEEQYFFSNYVQKLSNLYGQNTEVYQKLTKDVANDDYSYYRSTNFDNNKTSILDRYKNFNGLDGNSPTSDQWTEDYNTSSTTLPDIEDINKDNTLNESERYYQYKLSLRPLDMVIGKNYITDILTQSVKLKNNTTATVKWYQFKIPLNEPERIVGGIQDFKSIRFIRIFFKNFEKDVICRFASLDIVRSEWRKYNFSMMAPGEFITDDNLSQTSFDVTTVNIEENGKKVPIPYVLPPDIERETNLGTTNLQKLNEQSLSIRVCNLQDGDAKAIYKTAELDIRQYKKLKMFVHAEAMEDMDAFKQGDLTAFIRLGTDFSGNYYEYEIPITPSNWNSTTKNEIWPTENMFDIELKKLQAAKQSRNQKAKESDNVNYLLPYVYNDGNNKITVVGTPNLSEVRAIMIGIRNPKKMLNNTKDDGLSKCAEIWVNELRLTDFDEKGGWAATGRVSTNLADLGDFSAAGTIITPGFGGIEQKIAERKKETLKQYDIATNVEVGKFFNEKVGLKIPMHFDYSQAFSTPEYNPLNPDVLLKDELKALGSKAEKEELRKKTEDYTMRKSINFVNVRKNKVGTGKNHIYDIENFNFTYAYTELQKRNYEIEYDFTKTHKGAIGYAFNLNPRKVAPLNNFKPLKTKYLRIIKDFNFYYLPKSFAFRTDLDRLYSEMQYRNNTPYDLKMEKSYMKNFTWNRNYSLKYDLTQSIKIDYNANANARIGERPGVIDKSNEEEFKLQRDSIWKSILNMGQVNNFNQSINVNYAIPINKIPIFDWISSSASYKGDFNWERASQAAVEFGNTIENGNTKQISGQFNFKNLYNKIEYFKKLQQKNPQTKVKAIGLASEDTLVKKKKTLKDNLNMGKDNLFKIILSLKTGSFSFSQSNGVLLPGFLKEPKYIGMDWKNQAPGLGFVFGLQPDSIEEYLSNAYSKGWMTTDSMFNVPYMTKYNENLNIRASLEPFPDFKLELNANSTYSISNQAYSQYDNGVYKSFGSTETGNYSKSFISIQTAFTKDDPKTNSSKTFDNFIKYTKIIADRLANRNNYWKTNVNSTADDTYPEGYGPTSQQVLIPAFIAAYGGKKPEKIKLDQIPSKTKTFPQIPLPNWKITYDGLSKIELLQQFLKTLTLSHSYRSSLNFGSFSRNQLYYENENFPGDDFVKQQLDTMYGNFISKYDLSVVSISEQFAPLISFNMEWNNSMSSNIEFRRSRNISLSLTNTQITEVNSKDIVMGLGYKFKEVGFNFLTKTKNQKLKSDINLKADLVIRNNKTILRKVVEDVNLVSSGQRVISINITADYAISERLVFRAFFEKSINKPFVSSQYPTSFTNAGVSVRFTLAP